MLSRLFLPSHSAPAKPISSRFGTCWGLCPRSAHCWKHRSAPFSSPVDRPRGSQRSHPQGHGRREALRDPASLQSAFLQGWEALKLQTDRQSHLALIVHLRAERCCIAAGTTYQPQSLAASNRMSVSRGKPNRAPWEQRATQEVAAACPLPLQRGGNHLPMCLCSWVRSPFQALSKYNGSNIDLLFSC